MRSAVEFIFVIAVWLVLMAISIAFAFAPIFLIGFLVLEALK